MSKTRELGISMSSGEYICLMDADDMFLPEKLLRQVLVFQRRPKVILCHTNIEILSELPDYPEILDRHFRLSDEDLAYDPGMNSDFFISNHICNSSVMVRASAVRNLAYGFDQLFQVEDWVLWNILATRGEFFYLGEVLTVYRFHDASMTYRMQNDDLARLYSRLEMLLALLGREKSYSKPAGRAIASLLERIIHHYGREGDSGLSIEPLNIK